MNRQIEMVVLWTLVIMGFLAHTMADVMPAFWGEQIVTMPTPAHSRELIAMMLGVCYTLPVLAIFLALWGKHKAWRIIHVLLTFIFTALCLLHMLEWIDEFNPVQLIVMPLMGLIGLILFVKSIKYAREKRNTEVEETENDADENEDTDENEAREDANEEQTNDNEAQANHGDTKESEAEENTNTK